VTAGDLYRPSAEGAGDAPSVLVFREDFLALSETFVRDHLLELPRYRVAALARSLNHPTLSVPGVPVHLLRARSVIGRAGQFTGYRLGFADSRLVTAAAREVLRTLRPDVLHAHFGPDAALVSVAAARAGVPLVATFHGYDVTQDHDSLRGGRTANTLLVDDWAAVVGRLAAVITVSSFLRDRLVDRGVPADKISVIACGVDTAAIPWSPPVVGGPVVFVGRLVEKKGLADLLDAVARLDRRPRIEVVGDGPLRAQLEARARRLGVDATFLGSLPTPRVVEAIRSAAVVAMPSRTASSGDTEGLPVVSLEASAVGRPVIGYRHAGMPEAVLDGSTGVLVAEGDVDALGRALGRALDDPDGLLRMSRAARAHVQSRFDRADLLARVADVYDRVRLTLGEGGGALLRGGRVVRWPIGWTEYVRAREWHERRGPAGDARPSERRTRP